MLQTYQVLEKVLLAKEEAEKHLRDSGLTWTILRPGGLKSDVSCFFCPSVIMIMMSPDCLHCTAQLVAVTPPHWLVGCLPA